MYFSVRFEKKVAVGITAVSFKNNRRIVTIELNSETWFLSRAQKLNVLSSRTECWCCPWKLSALKVGYQVRKRIRAEWTRIGDADATVRFLRSVLSFRLVAVLFLRPGPCSCRHCRSVNGLLLVPRIPGVPLVTIAEVERELFGSEQNCVCVCVYPTGLCWRNLKSSVTKSRIFNVPLTFWDPTVWGFDLCRLYRTLTPTLLTLQIFKAYTPYRCPLTDSALVFPEACKKHALTFTRRKRGAATRQKRRWRWRRRRAAPRAQGKDNDITA